MAEKYLLVSMDDDKSKKLGEVISNPTCKKIINLLSEREMSEADIANSLGLPMNTTEYNLKNLLDSGLIEKSKNFFWSPKGRKIATYKIANKLIVISPKRTNVYSKLKGIIPLVLASAAFTIFTFWYQNMQSSAALKTSLSESAGGLLSAAPAAITSSPATAQIAQSPIIQPWQWFLIIIWIVIIGFVGYSIFKREK